MTTAAERILKLTGKTPAPEHMNKKRPNRGNTANWGGKRSGAGGVKPTKQKTLEERGHKQLIDKHVNEDVEVTIMDKKTGKTLKLKKSRLLVMLEKLSNIGLAGAGNADAINKWLDRALGKPIQKLGGDDENPIRLLIDF